jgi:tripartite-type tricarboxylate transporter receptor subunit TctC
MKKLFAILITILTFSAQAVENITIKSMYNAQHTGHVALYKIMEQANAVQQQYNFVLEMKPGANGTLAVKDMNRVPTTSLALINAAYVQNTIDNVLNEADYVPVMSLGDACWFLVGNVGSEQQGLKSLTTATQSLVLGGPGIGSASHLMSLELSEKINVPIRFVSFKSGAEANIVLTGENGVHLSFMTANEYSSLKTQNPRLQRLAVHCERRLPEAPGVATTKQQGVNSPYIFNTVLASVNMPATKLQEIKTILNNAVRAVGQEQILAMSDFNPPNFRNQSVDDYHKEKVRIMKNALIKYRAEIETAR